VTLVRFKGQNHPQQVLVHGAKAHVDERATPPEYFAELDRRFRFTIDVAAYPHNAKCGRYFTPDLDGLAQTWAGERVWCNPPYSSIEPWVIKARESDAELVVMLLPANRTEQGWWQRQVEPYRDCDRGLRVEFLPGRLRFLSPGARRVGANERPPFGSCLLIWEPIRPLSSPSRKPAVAPESTR